MQQVTSSRKRRGLKPARCALVLLLVSAAAAQAVSLRGSQASLDRQNRQAHLHRLPFLNTPEDVRTAVRSGQLVPLLGNGDYYLKEVSFPYAQPETKLFVERLAQRYTEVCEEPLVVTSLTRARHRQPANASRRSVHPTGIGLDLRRSWSRRCRAWLEGVLLTLEDRGVLEATLEWQPVHYHLAIFPEPYRNLLRSLEPGETEFRVLRYRVSRGDTLARIARSHRLTVEQVKRTNGLRSDLIHPGQILLIPSSR